ncbi:S1 family peptidase [Actinosynnema sp. CA-248983]
MRTLLIALTLLGTTATTPATAATTAAIPLEAGTPLTSSTGARCVNGFNADGYLMLHPSCAGENTTVKGPGGGTIGPVVSARPTYSIVKVVDPSQWDQLPRAAGTTITGSVETPVGGTVCMVSPTTGRRCGTVTAKNATVTFPQGTISGLTRVNLCAQTGDQWAALTSGTQAQGHVLGGSGCSTYFQPINRILAAEGLTLLTW